MGSCVCWLGASSADLEIGPLLFLATPPSCLDSASNTDVTVIPSQFKVTKQILLHWQTFRDLKLMFPGSRRAEQEEDAQASPLLQANELAGPDQASPSG